MTEPHTYTLVSLTTGDFRWNRPYPSVPEFTIVSTDHLPEAVRGVNKQVVFYSDEGKEIRRTARENGVKLDLTDGAPSVPLLPMTNVISLVGSDGFGCGEDF